MSHLLFLLPSTQERINIRSAKLSRNSSTTTSYLLVLSLSLSLSLSLFHSYQGTYFILQFDNYVMIVMTVMIIPRLLSSIPLFINSIMLASNFYMHLCKHYNLQDKDLSVQISLQQFAQCKSTCTNTMFAWCSLHDYANTIVRKHPNDDTAG